MRQRIVGNKLVSTIETRPSGLNGEVESRGVTIGDVVTVAVDSHADRHRRLDGHQ
jgi:hypothetical protein